MDDLRQKMDGNDLIGIKNHVITAQNISKGYENSHSRIEILNGINLSLNSGESLAVVGESGIGKSTLLHILGTLDRPDEGTLWFKDENVLSFNDSKLAKFRNESIGFIFQFHHLLPEFSAIENAMMPALIHGVNKKNAMGEAKEILIRVGLKERLHHKANKLSGGELQRVALARALVLKPMLLLADEPTGNLDKKNSDRVHELFLELINELGMTLVMVTHNMELASYMSRRLTIVDGKLVEL